MSEQQTVQPQYRKHNCFFMGRLVRDPELNVTPTGKITCDFRIARNRGPGRPATFMNCKAWGNLAEVVVENYRKGDMIRVRQSVYDTRALKQEGGRTVEYPYFTIYEIGRDGEAIGAEDSGGETDSTENIPY